MCKGINLTDENIYSILQEILNENVNDSVRFTIKNSKPIREEDRYGGLKYNLIANYENIKVDLSIDIATGDLITPSEIEYNYKMMFEDRCLKIMTYNVETIIAEKFQTVIDKGVLNSRMKDYYDIYYLFSNEKLSKDNLKLAILKTFNNRNTDINKIEKTIREIENSEFVKELWTNYSKKYSYSDGLEFKSIINVFKNKV